MIKVPFVNPTQEEVHKVAYGFDYVAGGEFISP
jgi:hypothetical protein